MHNDNQHLTSMSGDKPPINWTTTGFFIMTNVAVVTIVPWYGLSQGYSAAAWLMTGLFWAMNGVGITAGYHRLWSHRTYKAHKPLRWLLLIIGSMALQNSVLIWASRHRYHHRHTDDNERDPYSAKRGVWYSHMGWMIRDWPSCDLNFSNIKDLTDDPMLQWQHRHYWKIVWATNLGLPLLAGIVFGDIVGMLLLAGLARLVLNHHTTFFINSLAHFVGKQPYSDATTAKDSTLMASITWGEGYHNFHHSFQNDYRNGVRWWHIDVGKWFINVCSWIGLAYDLKRVPGFKIRRAQLQMLFKKAEASIETSPLALRWREHLETEYEAFSNTVRDWQQLQLQRMNAAGHQLRDRFADSVLRTRLKELDYALGQQRKRLRLLLQETATQQRASTT